MLRPASLFSGGGAALALASMVGACPPSMDVGTYAVDMYSANGGGASNLSYQVSLADNFYQKAASNLAGFPGCPMVANHPANFQNTTVTKALFANNTTNAFGDREFNDF